MRIPLSTVHLIYSGVSVNSKLIFSSVFSAYNASLSSSSLYCITYVGLGYPVAEQTMPILGFVTDTVSLMTGK